MFAFLYPGIFSWCLIADNNFIVSQIWTSLAACLLLFYGKHHNGLEKVFSNYTDHATSTKLS